nr:aldo/keto reductase [Demequina lutea]
MPLVGLGMLHVSSEEAIEPVRFALEAGYRAIDTAAVYGNEAGVGQAIRESALERDDVFVTTKVWNTDHGYDETMRAFDKSLGRLGLDYVDLYLIHWPMVSVGKIAETWRALEEIKRQGRTRSIGVSNFMVKHLEQLARDSDEVPSVNQIELHPWLQQRELEGYHAAHGIRTEAWSPLGQGKVLQNPTVMAIGARHKKSAAQVILRWHIDCGRVVIPKSVNGARIRENIDVFDFVLDSDEMAAMASLNTDRRIGSHPDSPPTVGLPFDD